MEAEKQRVPREPSDLHVEKRKKETTETEEKKGTKKIANEKKKMASIEFVSPAMLFREGWGGGGGGHGERFRRASKRARVIYKRPNDY